MRTYLLYIVGLVALTVVLAVSIQSRLLWPSVALAVALLWLCVSLNSRMERLRYAYRETERENERLHTRLADAERQLQYLRQLTENVDTALFVCSTDGRIEWMNHAAAPLLSPQLGGSLDSQQASPSGGRLEGASLPPHILQAIADHAEVVDGCALSTVLLRIDGHRRLVVALKDVSALMQRQEMEAWQQLIRVLTHEIMNSLTPIICISETLGVAPSNLPQLGEAPFAEHHSATASPGWGRREGAEAFAVINRRCHALLDFVENYRQLTRIKAPECTTFPVSELFAHLKALFPKLSTSLPHRDYREGQGESLLSADRSQLEQVLINLIKNAYESGATEVELSMQPLPSLQGGAGGGALIRVKDNGSGMSPDVVDHAFIPFFTTKPNGTGIGLSLCRQIILKHGGTIRVDSEEGRGTTFIIKV